MSQRREPERSGQRGEPKRFDRGELEMPSREDGQRSVARDVYPYGWAQGLKHKGQPKRFAREMRPEMRDRRC